MKITPELMVKNVPTSLAFYREVLGFTVAVTFPEDKPVFALISNEEAEVMLYEEVAFRSEMPHLTQPIGGTTALYIDVTDIEAWARKLRDKTIINVHATSYGTKEFACLDPDGYTLIFAENV